MRITELQPWQQSLETVCIAVFTGIFDADMYEEIYNNGKELLWYVTVFVMRVVMLVLFPISIPITFFIVRKIQKNKINNP